MGRRLRSPRLPGVDVPGVEASMSPRPQPRRSRRWADVYVCMLADGVALRNRCPQGQADPRAAIAGGASGVTMARRVGLALPSMRWADVSPASMSGVDAMGRRLRLRAWAPSMRWADVYVSGLGSARARWPGPTSSLPVPRAR